MKLLTINKNYNGDWNKNSTPLQELAAMESLTDAEIKWNFLCALALTGHPVTQDDVDKFRKDIRDKLIPMVREFLLKEKLFIEENM